MYTTEIDSCRIAITKKRKSKNKRAGAPEVFVPISYFTVAQLRLMLNEITRFPLKTTHLFAFDGAWYLVRVYSDDPDRQKEDDKGGTRWVG